MINLFRTMILSKSIQLCPWGLQQNNEDRQNGDKKCKTHKDNTNIGRAIPQRPHVKTVWCIHV